MTVGPMNPATCDDAPWTVDTDPSLGDYDQEYVDADDPDDVTTDPAANECILDPDDAEVYTDSLSGCITGMVTGIIVGGEGGVVIRRSIRFRYIHMTRRRLKKKT